MEIPISLPDETPQNDEYRLLTGSDANMSVPLRMDDRWWIRWPARLCMSPIPSFLQSYFNFLLIFVPFGIISANSARWNAPQTFLCNAFAIVPILNLINLTFDGLSIILDKDKFYGGLANAALANMIPLLFGILALTQHEVQLTRSLVMGNILIDMLLGPGLCFILAGFKSAMVYFSPASHLLTCLCLTTIFPFSLTSNWLQLGTDKPLPIALSRGTAIALLAIYAVWLRFRYSTHREVLFEGLWADPLNGREDFSEDTRPFVPRINSDEWDSPVMGDSSESARETYEPYTSSLRVSKRRITRTQLFVLAPFSLLLLAAAALLIWYMIQSIRPLSQETGISKTFIGEIIIPIIGHIPAYSTTAFVISLDPRQIDTVINLTFGSSVDIAYFTFPVLVIIGWIIRIELTMDFQLFEIASLFLGGVLTNFMVRRGNMNYLDGAACYALYTMFALACFVYPNITG